MTAATQQIINLATRLGYAVETRPGARVTELVIDQPGHDGHFGVIFVGNRSGRILRTNLARIVGSRVVERKALGAVATRALIAAGI